MNKYFLAAPPIALALGLALLQMHHQSIDAANTAAVSHESAPTGSAHAMADTTASPWKVNPSSTAAMNPPPADPGAQTLKSNVKIRFTANSQGDLTVNEQARNDLEHLVSLETREGAQAKLRDLSKDLPPVAQRQLSDLMFKYQQYSAALTQALPPGEAPETAKEVMDQFKVLHSTREDHFGPESAKALFGDEEKNTLQLIELIQTRAQKDPNLTLEQSVELAQEEYTKLHKQDKPVAKPSP